VTAKGRTLRVGVFVGVGLVLATIAIFVIGDSRRVWDRKVTFHAAYDDVVGLRAGSVVRMGGVDIGSIVTVEHSKEPDDAKVYVTFSISREEATRIRQATVARIEGKGLLGDKMVQLTFDEELAKRLREQNKDPRARIPYDGWLATVPASDPFGDAQKAAQSARIAIENVQKVLESVTDDRFKDDLRGTVHSLRDVLDAVAQKDGVAHRLIYDPEEAKRMDRILGNLEVTTQNLARLTGDARELTAQVKTGPGLAHAIVYDDQLAQGTVGSMVELHKTLAAVRTGNGPMHAVVYGDDQTQHLMGNMQAMSEDLREIVAGVKAGRGTVGALLVDPTVYEDIKSLVGNVERNQVLRALVRYSIKQNEDRPHAEVKGDAPQPVVQPAAQASPR
jgi:phospholipid/cholesterol/gamma-HCH transport system substrate-binding protein